METKDNDQAHPRVTSRDDGGHVPSVRKNGDISTPEAGSAGHSPQSTLLEPLAVVGLSFKFPQEALSTEAFWKMLLNKRNVATEIPRDRINIDAFYHPDPGRPDTTNCRGGHFLRDPIENFDAPFFSITGAEAEAMDPQHRLALETTYHALENAGIPMEVVSGSRTSVHAGCFTDDYRALAEEDPQDTPLHACTGLAASMLPNRISWFFNLLGASIFTNTACSSSMVALDLACQGLIRGDADTALVLGSNLMLSLELFLILSRMNFLSPDSQCYSFDSRANGYGRGEGVGVLVIKRLSDALKAEDTIRAVIRSTGVNQDGKTPGITQPSLSAQEQLIKSTYAKAGLDMAVTRYVEAHGTGTSVGDPIEATAIGHAFGPYRLPSQPIYIGSVKSNIGHLEGASGLAGVIKTILLLERGVILPNGNFERLHSAIDDERLRLSVPTHAMPWPNKGLRRASVSSFGFGGANCHVVLDDAYHFLEQNNLTGNHWTCAEPPASDAISSMYHEPILSSIVKRRALTKSSPEKLPPKRLLLFSTADKDGINRMTMALSRFGAYLEKSLTQEDRQVYMDNLAYTLCERRSHLTWRSFAVVGSLIDLTNLHQMCSQPRKYVTAPSLAWVFNGQGSQYAHMAEELLHCSVFRKSVSRSEAFVHRLGCNWKITDEISRELDGSRVDEPEVSQISCTALQIGLVDLLRSVNVMPSVVIGHSSGEIAAAYATGALSQESACKVAYYRGLCAAHLQSLQSDSGAMMSVGLSDAGFLHYQKQLQAVFSSALDVHIACYNSPTSITLSGDARQLDWVSSKLTEDRVFARKLRIGVAYHSPRMQLIADLYSHLIGSLESDNLRQGVQMMSTVTRELVPRSDLLSSRYWIENTTRPVRFSDALSTLLRPDQDFKAVSSIRTPGEGSSITDILEIGPHGSLRAPIQQVLRKCHAQSVSYLSLLDRSLPGQETFLNAIGGLHCAGFDVNVLKAHEIMQCRLCDHLTLPDIPAYPFNHSRAYWRESRSSRVGYRTRPHGRLDLLGSPASDWNPLQARWKNTISISEQPWIRDHVVKGIIVYPGAGLVAMALEATMQLADNNRPISAYVVKNALFVKTLTIPEDPGKRSVEIVLRPVRSSTQSTITAWTFNVYATDEEGQWQEHCHGETQVDYIQTVDDVDAGNETSKRMSKHKQRMESARRHCSTDLKAEELYNFGQQIGFVYGPAFRRITHAKYSRSHGALTTIATYEWPNENMTDFPQPHLIHPTTLDCMLQSCLITLSDGLNEHIPGYMPMRLGRLWIRNGGASTPSLISIEVSAQASFYGPRKATADILAVDKTSDVTVVTISELQVVRITSDSETAQTANGEIPVGFEVSWKPNIDLMNSKQLASYCKLEQSAGKENEEEFFKKLSLIILHSISDVLRSVRRTGVANSLPHFSRWWDWADDLLRRFNEGSFGHLKPSDPIWELLSSDPKFKGDLLRDVKETSQGEFYALIASKLSLILSGEIDTLQLMFQDSAATEYYKELSQQISCWAPLQKLVRLMTHKDPSMKILEVGAGTGASTDRVLDMFNLSGDSKASCLTCSQYDFTDISPAFFENAAQRYKGYGHAMNFFVLDVEKAPEDQGIEPGSYDIVVASSVLHATRNLQNTILNIRKLLKPGGKLFLLEIVREVARTGFAFGLLPGWWLAEEETRRMRPWLSTTEWHYLLRESGFNGVELEFPDFEQGISHEYSLIVSTAEADRPTMSRNDHHSELKPTRTSTIILINDRIDIQKSVSAKIRESLNGKGGRCDVVSWSSISETTLLAYKDSEFISLCEIQHSVISELDEGAFATLKALLLMATRILWVTSGGGNGIGDPRLHTIDGLARTASTENVQLLFSTLALSPENEDIQTITEKVLQVAANNVDKFEPEHLEQDGYLNINRVVFSTALDTEITARKGEERRVNQAFGNEEALSLQIGSIGLLETLHFVQDPEHCRPLPSGYLEIKVVSTGVNFRDCLAALGQLEDQDIGGECAGVVSKVGEGSPFTIGERVAAMFANSFQTYARGPAHAAVRVPDKISLVDASAVLVVFATAWYCLTKVARLQKGESILIHSAAGGTGQAAIQVAQHLGAIVSATVGSVQKKEFLMEQYGIPANRIFYSRNPSFAEGVLRQTGGYGIDVILNSLSGENLMASIECIAPFGRFIEIGKRDTLSRGQLPMYPLRKNCTFAIVDLVGLLLERPRMIQDVFSEIMNLFSQGIISVPKPLKIFRASEVEEAFRAFQTGQTFGKMVVELHTDDVVTTVVKPAPAYSFNASRTYVIAGGFGRMGRSIALWMSGRGARNLIILSRSGISSEAARECVRSLVAAGVSLQAPQCDIGDKQSLAAALSASAGILPPIAGCIQATMVLRDAVLENMSFQDWIEACNPKIQGSWNLHTQLPPNMDFFVCLSSLASIIGNGGQANYSAANGFMDELVRHRIAHGKRATSVNLGWVRTGPSVEEDPALRARFAKFKNIPIMSEAELFAALEYACDPDAASGCQILTGIRAPDDVPIEALLTNVPWIQKPTFRHTVHAALFGSRRYSGGADSRDTDYTTMFREATSAYDATQIVCLCLQTRLARALSIAPSDVDLTKPLHASGVDSLLAVELRNFLAKSFDAEIEVFDIMNTRSIEGIAVLITKRSSLQLNNI